MSPCVGELPPPPARGSTGLSVRRLERAARHARSHGDLGEGRPQDVNARSTTRFPARVGVLPRGGHYSCGDDSRVGSPNLVLPLP